VDSEHVKNSEQQCGTLLLEILTENQARPDGKYAQLERSKLGYNVIALRDKLTPWEGSIW
jgi:hypothetical protein